MSCTWIGHGEKCTKPVIKGKHYCEDHYYLIYQKGSADAKRRKDLARATAIWSLENEFNEAVRELVEEGFEI